MLSVEFFTNHDDRGEPIETEVQEFSDIQSAIPYIVDHADSYIGSPDFYLRSDRAAPIASVRQNEGDDEEILSLDIRNDKGDMRFRTAGYIELTLKLEVALQYKGYNPEEGYLPSEGDRKRLFRA